MSGITVRVESGCHPLATAIVNDAMEIKKIVSFNIEQKDVRVEPGMALIIPGFSSLTPGDHEMSNYAMTEKEIVTGEWMFIVAYDDENDEISGFDKVWPDVERYLTFYFKLTDGVWVATSKVTKE